MDLSRYYRNGRPFHRSVHYSISSLYPKGKSKRKWRPTTPCYADMSYWICLILGPLMFKCWTSMKKKKKHEDIDISEHGLTSAAACISLELLNVKLHSSLVYS